MELMILGVGIYMLSTMLVSIVFSRALTKKAEIKIKHPRK